MTDIAQCFSDEPLVVVDVGARLGIDRRWTELLGDFRAVLFEPEEKEAEKLGRELSDKYTVMSLALSDAKRSRTLYVCESPGCSSLHKPKMSFLSRFPKSERFDVVVEQQLETVALDDAMSRAGFGYCDHIKIDTQGHELQIVQGGSEALKTCLCLETEVEFSTMYDGQCLFSDIDPVIRDAGFELFDLRRSYWQREQPDHVSYVKGQLVFGDALYFVSPERLLDEERNPARLMKAVVCYCAYGHVDVADLLAREIIAQSLVPQACAEPLKAFVTKAKAEARRNRNPFMRLWKELSWMRSKQRFGTKWFVGDTTFGNRTIF